MKNSYELRAQKFIRQIFPFICECDLPQDYNHAVWVYNSKYNRNVKMKHGQTRIVLITADYVVKIDFGKNACYFGGCEDELKVYERAVEAGYAYLFAKISPYSYGGKTFYIMPRVHNIGRSDEDAYDLVKPDECDWLYDNVCDLHYENYGFVGNRVVLVDYACRDDLDRAPGFPSTWYSTDD